MRVGGGDVVPVGEPLLDHQQREHRAHHRLPGQLGAAAQAQAPLLADLDEVVDDTDEAEPGHQHHDQQPGHRGHLPGGHVPDEVPDHRGDDDNRPAHGGRAPLGDVRRRALFPDQLPVSAPGEDLDRQRGAQQRQHQRDPASHEDGLHLAASPVRARATRSRPIVRDALTSTTSPGPRRFPSAATALPASGTLISLPRQDRSALAPVSIGAAFSPTTMSPATPARAASPPASSCRCRDSSPSSFIGPSTANARRPRATVAKVARAAAIPSGFALYASLITVTPSARSVTSIRHLLRAVAADRPSATAATGRPSSPAIAAAARAFTTLCAPSRRSRTGTVPAGVTSVNAARPSPPSVTPSPWTVAPGRRPNVTTRAAIRSAMASTRGSSAFSSATPSAGRAAGSSPLARATSARPPNSPAWARPTLSTAPSRGGAIAQSCAICPGPRADSSRTRYRVSAVIRSTVSGWPISLL